MDDFCLYSFDAVQDRLAQLASELNTDENRAALFAALLGKNFSTVNEISQEIESIITGMDIPAIAFDVYISGDAEVGKSISGEYAYFSNKGKPEKGSTYRWLTINADGSVDVVGTERSYTPTVADGGKDISFEVTPMADADLEFGTSVKSAPIRIIGVPESVNVTIDGKAKEGSLLIGKYDYAHPNGIAEGDSLYKLKNCRF